MVKPITIKDDVYNKLKNQKRKDEGFSDLFERLVERNLYGGMDALKKLKGFIEFRKKEKEKILAEMASKRSERRFRL
jgi:predicted CopG family antitoxin